MAKAGLAARRSALWLIWQVSEGLLLSELLPKAVEKLEPKDRARAQRLAQSTLRWADRADRMLGPYLRHKPEDAVLNALRLGVVEMTVDGAAPHGVIDAIVELMRRSRMTRSAAGLVNAVLRRVSGDLEKWADLPPPRLPKPMRKLLVADHGKSAVEAIELANLRPPDLDLTPKSDATKVAEMTGGTLLPTGSVRISQPGQVSAIPGYDTGDWWVQDAAAALPVRILAPKPTERILDLCAAPGGKTMQIAAAGADVTAVEISETRMVRMRENLKRTGLSAEIKICDVQDFADSDGFDAILLDAPCSATGTIRRHPDLPIAKADLKFQELFALQSRFLDAAIALLRPGGRLVYCTCSLFRAEGEDQIETLLGRSDAVSVNSGAHMVPGVEPEWLVPEGLRLRPDYWPELGGMDGFFISALRKTA